MIFRYFCDGIKTRLLNLLDETSEKAVKMNSLIIKTLAHYELDVSKMVALTADNTNSNFGLNRGGSNNLYSLLKRGIFLHYI